MILTRRRRSLRRNPGPGRYQGADYYEEMVSEIERMVDAGDMGVSHVLSALADVCGRKAEFVQQNWQDMSLARVWAAAEHTVQRAAERVNL